MLRYTNTDDTVCVRYDATETIIFADGRLSRADLEKLIEALRAALEVRDPNPDLLDE